MRYFDIRVVFLAAALALAGCGGGGSSSGDSDPPPATNAAPVANAGADKVVNEGEEVSLDGSGSDSDGSVTGYTWSQTAGEDVTYNDFDGEGSISFVAPETTEPVTLEFRLIVTDNDGAKSEPDLVTVEVNPVNDPPAADAGPDREVDGETTVYIDGQGSDGDGSVASYEWKQVSGSPVELLEADSAEVNFVAPSTDEVLTLELQFSVTDDEGAVASDDVMVTVIPENAPALALAFPPASGAYLEDMIDVFGTVEAKNGADIASVRVEVGEEEQEAVVDADGSWRAADLNLPTDVDEFEIVITALDSAGLERSQVSHLITSDTSVGSGESWWSSTAIALSQNRKIAYVLTDGPSVADVKVVPVNLDTGERSESITNFSDAGQGPVATAFKDMILADGLSLYLSVASTEPYAAIMKVEMLTGSRTVVSDDSTGSGEGFAVPSGLALGEEGGVLYVADNGKDTGGEDIGAIFQVDTGTGERTIVAGSDTVDYPVQVPLDLVWNETDQQLLFTENLTNDAPVMGLDLSVDPAVTNLVTFNDMDGEPLHAFSQGIEVDGELGVAYVMNGGNDNIVAVNLATGTRALVASEVTGSKSCDIVCEEASEYTKGFAYNPVKKLLYVAGGGIAGNDALFVIDPQSGDKVVLSR